MVKQPGLDRFGTLRDRCLVALVWGSRPIPPGSLGAPITSVLRLVEDGYSFFQTLSKCHVFNRKRLAKINGRVDILRRGDGRGPALNALSQKTSEEQVGQINPPSPDHY